MGVYQIRNQVNCKIWVASSLNLHGAANRFPLQFATGTHLVKDLQEDWKRYGGDSFVFEILETVNPDDYPQEDWASAVAMLEEIWLEKQQPYGDRGYNKAKK